MSVCKKCRDAVESDAPVLPYCSVCGKGPIAVYRTDVPESDQRAYVHKNDATGARCDGSRAAPRFRPVGHCNDLCTCQHRRKGAWRGGPSH